MLAPARHRFSVKEYYRMAETGVPEAWIVNLNELSVEVYREPHFTGYGNKTVLKAGATATPLAFPDVAVRVGELLKR